MCISRYFLLYWAFLSILRFVSPCALETHDATTQNASFVRDRNSQNSPKIFRKPSTPTSKRNVELIPMSWPSSRCMPIIENKKSMLHG